MKINDRIGGVSRRDFFKVAGTYGLSSTLLAASAFGGAMTAGNLASAAESTYTRRFSKEAKFTLKFGAAGFNPQNLLIERAGALEFARDIESRTDGEIRVEFIGNNQICGQTSCVEKTQQGITDIYAASTQNSAGGAPYLNVLDYAYMFRNRADQYHFLYSPKSQALLRDPYEKNHGLKFLFSHAELRGIQLGMAWDDKPTVTSVEQLFGTKKSRHRHTAWSHRDESLEPEPSSSCMGRNTRRSEARLDRWCGNMGVSCGVCEYVPSGVSVCSLELLLRD